MKEKSKGLFQEEIKRYLDNRAQEDEQFAVSYSKETKSIEECCNYIIQEVRKTGRIGFADEEIYSLAVHYYDEDNLGKIGDSNVHVVVNRRIELSEEQKEKLQQEAEEAYKREKMSELRRKEEEAKKKAAEKAKAEAEKYANVPSLFDAL